MNLGRGVSDESYRIGHIGNVDLDTESLGDVVVKRYNEPEDRGDCHKSEKRDGVAEPGRIFDPVPVNAHIFEIEFHFCS